MKTTLHSLLLALAFVAPATAQTAPKKKLPAITDQPAAAPVADPGWPRVIERDGMRLLYEQPQIDEWKDYRSLKARVAFSLTQADGKATVGIAELVGNTVANLEARTVFIEKVTIAAARFPGLSETEAPLMEAGLKKAFPGRAITVSLDRLIAGVERTKESFKTVELNMEAPPVFAGSAPSALLIVDGKPVLAPVPETKLQFLVNTNWDVFFEPEAKAYYLLSDKTWLTSDALESGWSLAVKVPDEFKKLPKDWDHVKKTLPVKVTKGMKIPALYFSDKPAELIEFNGAAPVFAKVEGTRLLWANNTESWLFQNTADSQLYFLTSGRWFRSAKLEGPWTYAGNDLPEDFKVIPPSHACADVLASVPGTQEAEDAVLLAQIPTQATVKRAEAEGKAAVKYDGEPAFTPVAGTTVSYATNTPNDVILVEKNYYLCLDAVWFISTAATGPWKICTTIPAVIYTIPASCPVHRVTYVKVEVNDDPDVVVCSYTAGYNGAFIAGMAIGAALVWGTGYHYHPYVYYGGACPIYRPYPYSYGVAAAYNPWTGGYAVGHRAYGPYGSAGRAAWYNPATGGYGRVASVQGPYGGRTVAAGYNPRSDTAWATRQGNNGYAQWGTSAVSRGNDYVRAGHIATEEGGVARWQGSNGGGKVKWTEDGAKGVAVHDGNMYAGKDGNVYRRDENGDWDKYGGGGDWEKTNTPNRPDNVNKPRTSTQSTGAAKRPGTTTKNTPDSIERRPATRPAQAAPAQGTMDNLNREAQSRDRGVTEASRQQNFQRSTAPATRPATAERNTGSFDRQAGASSRSFNRSGTPRAGGGGASRGGGGGGGEGGGGRGRR